MSHTLIVLPDDTAEPILDAINSATHALDIGMFLFSDPTLLEAVVAAHHRGVKVRVMLNPARRDGQIENEEARKRLTDVGVAVRDSNPAFAVTHQKSLVVDNKIGLVESLNWEPMDLSRTRDYAIVTTRGVEIDEMTACFDADWDHKEFQPPHGSSLIWCPNNGRQRLAAFIDAAQATLWLQNERYQDEVIIERLVRAICRGVKVRILAKPPHSMNPDKLTECIEGLRILQDVGAKIRVLKHLKLHAKMMLADDERAIIGSINLAPGSFDSRRELAITTDHRKTIERLLKVAYHDWSKAHKLDLSDAALLADLRKHDIDPTELALYEDIEHWGYHPRYRMAQEDGSEGAERHDTKETVSAT